MTKPKVGDKVKISSIGKEMPEIDGVVTSLTDDGWSITVDESLIKKGIIPKLKVTK